jgi:hypothetical protein
MLNLDAMCAVVKEMWSVMNVMEEVALDARTATGVLSNVVLVVVCMKWNVQIVMDLEKMKMVVSARVAQVQERIHVKSVVVKI